jgi:uncharacterized protein YukE
VNTLNDVIRKFPVHFQKVGNHDERFISVKIWLMHTGKNQNGSYFSKDVVQKAIPSLANTPILGYIIKNSSGEYDFSDHRSVLKKNEKTGRFELTYIGQAIGVIPETNNAQFEMKMCDDGIEREFLTVEGLVWNKWGVPEEILLRDLEKGQSMELSDEFDGHVKDDKLFHFTNFKFFGACILGDVERPAMNGAEVEVNFCMDENWQKQVQEEVEMFKLLYTKYQEPNGKDISNKKEGEFMKEKIIAALGEHEKLSYVDHNDSSVIVYSAEDSSLVGLNYSVNEDVVGINFDSKEKYKVSYVKAEENEEVNFSFVPKEILESSTTQFTQEKESLEAKVSEIQSQLDSVQSEFSTAKESFESEKAGLQSQVTEFESIKSQLSELQEFKALKESEEREAKVNELFSKFTEQLTEEEINFVRENFSQSDLGDIEKELYVALGKKASSTKFTQKTQTQPNKLSIVQQKQDGKGSSYEYIIKEYLEKNNL